MELGLTMQATNLLDAFYPETASVQPYILQFFKWRMPFGIERPGGSRPIAGPYLRA